MKEDSKKSVTRRRFIKTSTLVALGTGAALGTISIPLLRSEQILLRPPGALDEDQFLASCIKCGQCLQVCPPQVIELAEISQGFGFATPYITPRSGACILCGGLPCVLACPTGALDHGISLGKEAKMGLAVFKHKSGCLARFNTNDLVYGFMNQKPADDENFQPGKMKSLLMELVRRTTVVEKKVLLSELNLKECGEKSVASLVPKIDSEKLAWLLSFTKRTQQAETGCRLCLDKCPIKEEKTIVFKRGRHSAKAYHPKVQETCVGCGVCEEVCPLPEAVIKVVPRLTWTESQTKTHHTDHKESKDEKRS